MPQTARFFRRKISFSAAPEDELSLALYSRSSSYSSALDGRLFFFISCKPYSFFNMGTGKKEANRKMRQGKTGDGMANVKVKGENFYRYLIVGMDFLGTCC